ncbi:MAG: CoA pyrophosphatase [Planctomycetota bacterium]
MSDGSRSSFFIQRPETGFSPRLCYGRHRGPARIGCRLAAVIVAIYPQRESGRWCLTLTRRPTTLSHHGGQVCLPGGRIEPDETSLDAALREYREELGVELQIQQVIGQLNPIYVFASDNRVETWVVVAQTPSQVWQPDPVEVDQVIEMPVSVLTNLGQRDTESFGSIEQSQTRVRKKSVRVGKVHSPGQVMSGEATIRTNAWPKNKVAGTSDSASDFSYAFSYQSIRFTDSDQRQVDVWGATAMLLGELALRLDSMNVVLRD